MKISQRWLKELVPFRWTPEQFVERLTMVGLEVEQAEDQAKTFENFVVGEVLERQKHPNADKLSVCRVHIGTEEKRIVCGAQNVAAGQKVAVALVGATIPHDQHDPDGKPFVLGRATIRGVESDGMICSAFELGVGEDADGILVLDATAKTGTPLAKYFGMTDVVYEIGITPNRSDCLSHIGVAREVGALTGKAAALPRLKLKESKIRAASVASIKIKDAARCARYCGRVLRNVKIGPSPKWMQDRLTAVGVRPINVVVDVTNFVLMETGHPLHAFDLDRLAGRSIIVRMAEEGERFTTLDGKERALNGDMLMICDAERPVALAGVMGGANSEIGETTTNILLESAWFEPRGIRRTSKVLGLSTEASYRFERGADIEMARYAVDRTAQLIQEMTGAELLNGVIDVYPKKMHARLVPLRVSRANAIIGTKLNRAEVSRLLKTIGFVPAGGAGDVIKLRVPSYRTDVVEEIELIEEVARAHGYDNIATQTRAAIDFTAAVHTDRATTEIRNALIGGGFNEILAIGLQDEATMGISGQTPVKVLNPVSVEMSTLRTSLIPGALRIAQYNRNRGTKDLRLFEFGSVCRLLEGKDRESLEAYDEEERLLILMSGQVSPLGVGVQARNVDLLDGKGEVEALLKRFLLDKYRLIQYDTHNALTEPSVGIEINGTYAGFFGIVRPEIATRFDLEGEVFVCELIIPVVEQGWAKDRKFAALPKFPIVTRDLAITLDQALPQGQVESVIRQAGDSLLVAVTLFDVYEGKQVGEGRKSLAYALEFRSSDHTLKDAEVDAVMSRVIQAVKKHCGGELRA